MATVVRSPDNVPSFLPRVNEMNKILARKCGWKPWGNGTKRDER
jgi:hypothetical protein